MITATAAPAYIAADAYTGRHTVLKPRAPFRPEAWKAGDLAALAATGVVWESCGEVRPGKEGFCRSRYVADAEGNLHVYDSTGRKVIVHPADRILRILVK